MVKGEAKTTAATKEAIGYENIIIDGILGRITLQNLSIKEKINEHVQVRLSGIIPIDVNVSLVFENYKKQIIRIRQVDENGSNVRVLFCGMIQNIEVTMMGELYLVEVQAISFTKKMDEVAQSRSFQDKDMLYASVFDIIMEEYETWRILDKSEKLNQPINKFILQYAFTDWQFAKLVASLLNIGLIADAQNESIDYYIGLPKRKSHGLDLIPFTTKRVPSQTARQLKNGLIQDAEEQDFIYYQLEPSLFWFEMGDEVFFEKKQCYVIEKHATLSREHALLQFYYVLTTENGAKIPRIYNDHIKGLSIGGTVIDNTHAYSRLRLFPKDKQTVETSTWFRQSVFYSAGDYRGWTAMNDINDAVLLYFPSPEENDAYILDSNQSHYAEIRDQVKYNDTIMMGGSIASLEGKTFPEHKTLYNPDRQVIDIDNDNLFISTRFKHSFMNFQKNDSNKMDGLIVRSRESLNIDGKTIDIGYKGKNIENKTKEITFTSAEQTELICGNSKVFLQADNPIITYTSPLIDVGRWKKKQSNKEDSVSDTFSDDDQNDYLIDVSSGFVFPTNDAENKEKPVDVSVCFDDENNRLVYNMDINICIDIQNGTATITDSNGDPVLVGNNTDGIYHFDPITAEGEIDEAIIADIENKIESEISGIYNVQGDTIIHDGTTRQSWDSCDIEGLTHVTVDGTKIPINQLEFKVNVNISTPQQAASNSTNKNTINIGIGYESSAGCNSHARQKYPRNNNTTLSTSGTDSLYDVVNHDEQTAPEGTSVNNPDIYINVGKKDGYLEAYDSGDYSKIAGTACHELLHILGLGDAYPQDGKTASPEGAESWVLATKDDGTTEDGTSSSHYTYNDPSIMMISTPSGKYPNGGSFRDVEATKLAAAITTKNYQAYQGYGSSSEGIGRQENVYNLDGYDPETGVVQSCKLNFIEEEKMGE